MAIIFYSVLCPQHICGFLLDTVFAHLKVPFAVRWRFWTIEGEIMNSGKMWEVVDTIAYSWFQKERGNPSYSQEPGKSFCWDFLRNLWKTICLFDQVGIPVQSSFIALFGWLRKNLFRKNWAAQYASQLDMRWWTKINRSYKIKKIQGLNFSCKRNFFLFFNWITICCMLLLLVLLGIFLVVFVLFFFK